MNKSKNSKKENILYKKPKIHFILPAGGMKGCFQFGFLYRLKKRYSHLFDLYQIDGTSVGALNGYAYAKNKLDYIKEIWLNIKGRDDFFSSLSRVPLLNYIVTGYNAIFGYGIYSNHKLEILCSMCTNIVIQFLYQRATTLKIFLMISFEILIFLLKIILFLYLSL